jgi:hypothetical protein
MVNGGEMTWALELRAMPNKQTGGLKVLAGWALALCLSAAAPVLAQVADQEPDTPITSDSEDVIPAITASDEVAAPLEPEAPTAPGSIVDYKPTESISEDLSVSFPVDI